MDSDIDGEDVIDGRCGTDEELLPYALAAVALTLQGDDIIVTLRRNSDGLLDVGESEKSHFFGDVEAEEQGGDGSASEHHPPPQAK
ncbi:hypothetical protein QYF36_019437 [Acer negundo]|nr:hypothetical protein QYF36_019437 [Acer negundo]